MPYPQYIARLIDAVDELKHRVLKECDALEGRGRDDLFEETAEFRNIAMELDGLKVMLRRIDGPGRASEADEM